MKKVLVSAWLLFGVQACATKAARPADSPILDVFAERARHYLERIPQWTTRSGSGTDSVLARIDALEAVLNKAKGQIAKAMETGDDPAWLKLEPQLAEVVEAIAKFREDEVFLDPVALSSDLFTIGPVANFAMRTKAFYDKVDAMFNEATSLAKVATALPAPDAMSRIVVTEVRDREVTQRTWWKSRPDGKRVRMTECKDAKDCNGGFTCKDRKCFAPRVPERRTVAVVKAMPDIGRQRIGRKKPARYDWKMVVITDQIDATGRRKAMVVSTKDVLQLDLTPAFTEMAERARVIITQRLANTVLELLALSERIQFGELEKRLKLCAEKKECGFEGWRPR